MPLNPKLPMFRDKAKTLPLEPGVYIMRDSSRHIIYIGKAKHLRLRVGSYFRAVNKHPEKTFRLVQNMDGFDYIVPQANLRHLSLNAA